MGFTSNQSLRQAPKSVERGTSEEQVPGNKCLFYYLILHTSQDSIDSVVYHELEHAVIHSLRCLVKDFNTVQLLTSQTMNEEDICHH